MKTNLFLSFSQISTFLDCERMWFLQKIEKLRPKHTGSALIFGGAIDNCIEHILLKKEGDYKDIFLETLRTFQVNKKGKKLPEDVEAVKFFVSDVDINLIKDLDLSEDFKLLGIEPLDIAEFLDYCKQLRKAKQEYSEVEKKLFNLLAYRSLEQKGLLIIEALKEWLDENVIEVHAVQKKIEIDDGNGNKFVGYLDFIVTLKGKLKLNLKKKDSFVFTAAKSRAKLNYEGYPHCKPRILLLDLKTSSDPNKYYPEDSASNSQQLSIYAQETGIMDVGYLVAGKKILKRNPRVKVKLVEGQITEEKLDEVFAEIEECVIMINEKLEYGAAAFEKNKELCNNCYGSKCDYIKYCWEGSTEGLEKV